MQKITRENLIERASVLLENGTADRVYGWKRGEFDWDVTPALFRTPSELDKYFVWNDFCGVNFSKYLVGETKKSDKKIIVFLKPCDTYSFNQLLTEHRFDREKVYAIGLPCGGMLDTSKLKTAADSLTAVNSDGNILKISTLYDGDITLPRSEMLPDRCINCKSKKHAAFDELIGDEGEVLQPDRFSEVERLEAMNPDERFAFWQGELSRCIRCNACRNACPACTCEKCVFDNPDSGVENKAAANSFEEKMFHIIRAIHVAGRCTDCGECSRVCPQHIPLHLLNRKFIKDIDGFYGEFQAGEEVGAVSPIISFDKQNDPEPSVINKEARNA